MRLCLQDKQRKGRERQGNRMFAPLSRRQRCGYSPQVTLPASTKLLPVAIQYFHPNAIRWNADTVIIAGYGSEIAYDHQRVVIGRRTP